MGRAEDSRAPTQVPVMSSRRNRSATSAILALQKEQGTLECYSKLKDKLCLKTG